VKNVSILEEATESNLLLYKTRMPLDYIHRPVFIDHDVSETGSLSVGFTPLHPPKDGERASLRNVVIYKNRTMDIVHKHSSLVHHAPLSESFQPNLLLLEEFYHLGCNVGQSTESQRT
jgi:hypothetical protein